jgi:hypothetical protein
VTDASDAPADERPEPAPKAPARRRRRRPQRPQGTPVMRRVEAVGAVVGVLAGLIGLADWVIGLRPDPPAAIDPRIEDVTTRNLQMPLADYVREEKPPGARYTAAELRQRGYVMSVTVRLVGLLGKEVPLRWSLYRRPEQRLRGPAYNQPVGEYVPQSADHRTSYRVWIPYPPRSGTYFARFTLIGPDGRPVSEMDSPDVRYPPR